MTCIPVSLIYGSSDPVPYTEQQAREIQLAQSGDVLFITHQQHPPATLTRHGDTDWRYEIMPFVNGPYMPYLKEDEGITMSLLNVVDSVVISSNVADFTSATIGSLIEYAINSRRVLGRVTSVYSPTSVQITPLLERCYIPSKEVYSPGIYSSWNGTTSVPVYTQDYDIGSVRDVAFSARNVVTRAMVGGYLNFADKLGNYYWMEISEVGDILEQSSYGIRATGTILNVIRPAGALSITEREITATLRSSRVNTFSDIDVGRWYKLSFEGRVIHAKITALTGLVYQTANVTMSDTVPFIQEGALTVQGSSTEDWNRGAWYTGNYPRTVTFYGERVIMGGTPRQKSSFWASETADLYAFADSDESGKQLDTSAIYATPAAEPLDEIQWIVNHITPKLGTTAGTWNVTAGNQNLAALTPSSIRVERHGSSGSADIKPAVVGSSVLYIQLGRSSLMEMQFDSTTESLLSRDLTVFAEHILRSRGGARKLLFQQLPVPCVYVLCTDGTIARLTYERDQNVYAWSTITIGGPGARVLDATVITEGEASFLVLVVLRNNGQSLEALTPQEFVTPKTELTFGDRIYRASFIGSKAIGLEDFYGAPVHVIADNVLLNNLSVDENGEIDLPFAPTTRVLVAHPFTAFFKSFPLDPAHPSGVAQGKLKRHIKSVVRVKDSVQFEIGTDPTNLSFVDTTLPSDPQYVFPPLRSIDAEVLMPDSGYNREGSLFVQSSTGHPLSILAIYPQFLSA